mmetsp:Transcript_6290/g.23734  ORF Transcript_6290/g.23734 Transcript_6290/m.23734 type:complete len:249 (+) Transcript_6290:930-1676(+)
MTSPATATTRFTKESFGPGPTPTVFLICSTSFGGGEKNTTSPTWVPTILRRRLSTNMVSPFKIVGAMEFELTLVICTRSVFVTPTVSNSNVEKLTVTPIAQNSSSNTDRSSAAFTSTSTLPQGVQVGFVSSAHSRQGEVFEVFEVSGGRSSIAYSGTLSSTPTPTLRQKRFFTKYRCPAYSPNGLQVHPAIAVPFLVMSRGLSFMSRVFRDALSRYRSNVLFTMESIRWGDPAGPPAFANFRETVSGE